MLCMDGSDGFVLLASSLLAPSLLLDSFNFKVDVNLGILLSSLFE